MKGTLRFLAFLMLLGSSLVHTPGARPSPLDSPEKLGKLSDGRWADQAPATPVLPGHEADTAV